MKKKSLILLATALIFYTVSWAQPTSYGGVTQPAPSTAGTGGNNTNAYFGHEAGLVNTGINNTFIGNQSGRSNTTGYENSALGSLTLIGNVSGARNTANGTYALYANTNGSLNTAVGYAALGFNTTSDGNTAIGYHAGINNATGDNNTYIGINSGFSNQTGSGNVFIGHRAGYNENGSDRLYIDNSDTSSPLIWGDFANDIVSFSANVGIGTNTPDATLAVRGDIHAQQVRIDLNGAVAPDFVFEPDYNLRTLEETEQYIKEHKHLPEIPSAAEMEENGVELKEMNLKLLQKIEELTLYTIDQHKILKQQQKMMDEMRKEIELLKNK